MFKTEVLSDCSDPGMLIEACAGLLDKDNSEDCIKREIEEETI